MKLIEIITKSLVFPILTETQKAPVLRTMVQGVAKEFPELKEEELFSVVMDREKLSSTGIGSGIAIPHAKLQECPRHIVVFGRSKIGIPFDAIDEKPVHLVFLILGPATANEMHLKILARISKFLHDTNFRDRLLTASDVEDIYGVIEEKDAQHA